MSSDAAPTASPVSAWNCTRKRLRAWYLPLSNRRVPAAYLRWSHGWLKKVASIVPVASATTAVTSGFMPRLRTGRLVMDRTSAITVATSSTASSAIVRALWRSRGRCSSRSPTVSRPSRSAAAAALAGVTSSGVASRDGRGQRAVVQRFGACEGGRPHAAHDDARRGLLGGDEPPVRRLAAPLVLELD